MWGTELSPVWDGQAATFERIRDWWDTPGRLNLKWSGMRGWELLFSPTPGEPPEVLPVGDRLLRVGSLLEAWPL